MPNHIHAIVVLKNSGDGIRGLYGMIYDVFVETDGHLLVEACGRAPLPINGSHHRLPKSISSFLAGFKSALSSKIDDYIDENQLNISKFHRNNHFFQTNY